MIDESSATTVPLRSPTKAVEVTVPVNVGLSLNPIATLRTLLLPIKDKLLPTVMVNVSLGEVAITNVPLAETVLKMLAGAAVTPVS
jgi:hypothetical protein